MAVLGQTGDPRALVPGQPEVIEADAAALAGHARRVEQVGAQLRTVEVSGWTGPAAANFAEAWAQQPAKWLKVADAIALATTELVGYAGTLRWAQAQAGDAIELWNRAALLTRDATASVAVERASIAATDNPADTPFVDPGEGPRRNAQEILVRARQRLREAGEQATRAISGGGVGAPFAMPGLGGRAGGALGDVVDALTGSAEVSGSFAAGGLTVAGRAGVNGPSHDLRLSGPAFDPSAGELKLGELQAHARVFDAAAAGSLRHGPLEVATRAEASLGVEAAAAAGIVRDGLTAVGVRAEAFGGARLSGHTGADVGGIAAGATGELWAGAGAELGAGYEFRDGRFTLGVEAGAALGVGGKVGFEVTVDPERVAHTAMDAAHAVGSGIEHLGDTAREIGDTLNPFDQPTTQTPPTTPTTP